MSELVKRLREIGNILSGRPVLGHWPSMKAESDRAVCNEAADRIAELERINFALNAAAWEFTHSWINNEVDQDDDEWMDVMADLTERAGAVMRLVRPPAA